MYIQSTRLVFIGFLIGAVVTSRNLQDLDCSKEENQQPVVEYYHQNGMQYLFFSQRVTWEEAKMLCRSYNAHMAILDTMEKAQTVAKSIATSNILMLGENIWIGGRRVDFVWYWIEKKSSMAEKNIISIESNVEDYPPWSRKPIRPTKECLAIDRRSHEHPNFLDLDCRLQRPFICEKKAGEIITRPIPSKWVQINKNTFILYYGKVTWQEAATFCRAQGARLAILKNAIVVGILASSMTKTRPDFETIWVGAHFSYGQWVWISSGAVLNLLTDAETGYPPWRYGRSETTGNGGCLLLDRHITDSNATFIEMPCDRKRDFLCEEYSEDEALEAGWMDDEPVKFSYENSTFIIYAIHKTWLESKIFCSERGSVFAHVDHMDAINLIVEAMGDHPRAISHVWLGGYYDEKVDEWRWIGNTKKIPKYRDESGYPPWAIGIDEAGGDFTENASCLNLDRSDHVKAHFYSLDCNSRQAFVCKITCDIPPAVRNGTWNCSETTDGQQCILQCDKGLVVMGLVKAICTFTSGWLSTRNSVEFPQCLTLKNYADRMFKSLSLDMQNSFGYYLLLDHSSSASMKSIAFEMAALLIQSYPLSSNLRGGMTTCMTDPPAFLPLNQTDGCLMLSSIYFIKQNIAENTTAVKPNVSRIYKDISMYNGRRISIIAIIDGERGSAYAKTLHRLKAAGHHITIIGLPKDWEILLPLATIGFDKRANLFLLDEDEFQIIISDRQQTNNQYKKCIIANNQPPVTNSSIDSVQTTLRSIPANDTNIYGQEGQVLRKLLPVVETATPQSSIETDTDTEY